MHLGPSAVRLELFLFPISKYDIFLIAGQVRMQLKVRVARFSKSAASGVAITKIGMIAISSATRADSGCDPRHYNIIYLEISDLKGDPILCSKRYYYFVERHGSVQNCDDIAFRFPAHP